VIPPFFQSSSGLQPLFLRDRELSGSQHIKSFCCMMIRAPGHTSGHLFLCLPACRALAGPKEPSAGAAEEQRRKQGAWMVGATASRAGWRPEKFRVRIAAGPRAGVVIGSTRDDRRRDRRSRWELSGERGQFRRSRQRAGTAGSELGRFGGEDPHYRAVTRDVASAVPHHCGELTALRYSKRTQFARSIDNRSRRRYD
jgi:hypothetical protein